jgi:bacterioferritin
MPDQKSNEIEISRDRLAELLNEDLAREYQAIITYVVYSQVLKGAEYMDIAAQLETHARQARSRPDPLATDRLSG